MSEGHFFLVLYRTNIKALRALCKNLELSVEYELLEKEEKNNFNQ